MADETEPRATLPAYITPKQLADHFGVSDRRIRDDARKSGHCHLIGGKMLLTSADVDALMEYWRPAPQIPRPREALPAPSGDYETLLALRHLKKSSGKRPGARLQRGRK